MMKTSTLRSVLKAASFGFSILWSIYSLAQTDPSSDLVYDFSAPSSVESWEFLSSGYPDSNVQISHENGSLGLTPSWRANDYVFTTTPLNATYDFSQAKVKGAVKFDEKFFTLVYDDFESSLARATVVLVDTDGRWALGEFHSPVPENKSEFSTFTFLQGEDSLVYADPGFDMTNVNAFGIGLLSINYDIVAAGLAQFDDITIDFDGAAEEPTALIDYPVYVSGWEHNHIARLWSTSKKGNKGKFSIFYNDDNTYGQNLEIYQNLSRTVNFTKGQISFDLLLPSTFDAIVNAIGVVLVDSKGNRAETYTLSAPNLLFGTTMNIAIDDLSRNKFISMDPDFDLAKVRSILVELRLPRENLTISGQVVFDYFHLQVHPKFEKNFFNPLRPSPIPAGALYPQVLLDDVPPNYESLHEFSVNNNDAVANLNWQDAEVEIHLSHFWERPVNLSSLEVTQRFYVPPREAESGMSLYLKLVDINMDEVEIPLATLDGGNTGGWTVVKFSSADLPDDLNLNYINEYIIIIKRNATYGHAGAFRFNPPAFSITR